MDKLTETAKYLTNVLYEKILLFDFQTVVRPALVHPVFIYYIHRVYNKYILVYCIYNNNRPSYAMYACFSLAKLQPGTEWSAMDA